MMKSNSDRPAGKYIPPTHNGQKVRVLDKASKTWILCQVTGHTGEASSYNVRTNLGWDPTSDTAEEVWGKFPNRTVQTLETGQAH